MKILKYWLVVFVCFCGQIKASDSLNEYLKLLETYEDTLGPLGDWQKGEIEIITDIEEIHQIEAKIGRKVGIVSQDKYWIWLNDAVRFPNGSEGIYGRLMWRESLHGFPGVAVLCLLPDGKIALNCNYRHATRSWELELPRGGIFQGETIAETAKREVLEETGMILEELILLGQMKSDTGFSNTRVPIFLAKVTGQGEALPEDSEAIEDVIPLTLDQVYEGLVEGKLSVYAKGKIIEASLQDPFLTFALLQAQLQGLINDGQLKAF